MTPQDDAKLEELHALVAEARARVSARYPEGSAETEAPGGLVKVPLADLMPLVHARDAAQAKMAAIGSVNPRAGGVLNALIQGGKRLIARSLNWFVRDQVTFNREMMQCVEASVQAINQLNQALVAMSGGGESEQSVGDIRAHWHQWRVEWEQKLIATETHFLRATGDLKLAQQHRVDQMDQHFHQSLQRQHEDFRASLEQAVTEVQRKLWADLERVKGEYERLIHAELRIIRQKTAGLTAGFAAAPPGPPAAAAPEAELPFDYQKFADKFRGPEEYVRRNHAWYLSLFEGCREVLDIGCGRGEMLQDLGARGIPARGIDLGAESVAYCRSRGLEVEHADLFAYLPQLNEATLDGVYCSQVVEHLPPLRLPEMIRLCAGKMKPGGVIAIETPNPECLAIFATHFYLDPTHYKPVPPALLAFYLEEAGFGRIEVHPLSPAAESIPELRELPEAVVRKLFGGMDYAITARKL